MRAPALAFALWLCAAVMTGCVAAAPTLDPLPLAADCACADGACPVAVCDVSIEVEAATCASEVDKVEILIGDTLEPAIFVPGQLGRTCATIPRGGKAWLRARADKAWSWEEELTCPAAAPGETSGPTIARVLHCAGGEAP